MNQEDLFWSVIEQSASGPEERQFRKLAQLLEKLSAGEVRGFAESLHAAIESVRAVEFTDPIAGGDLDGDALRAVSVSLIAKGRAAVIGAQRSGSAQIEIDDDFAETFLETVADRFESVTGEPFPVDDDSPRRDVDITVIVQNPYRLKHLTDIVAGANLAGAALEADGDLKEYLASGGQSRSIFITIGFVDERGGKRLVRSGRDIEANFFYEVREAGTVDDGWRYVRDSYEKVRAKYALRRSVRLDAGPSA